jgi:hypothetical protein
MWSIKNRRELVRVDAGDEIVAVWTERSGMTSLTKTEEFKIRRQRMYGSFWTSMGDHGCGECAMDMARGLPRSEGYCGCAWRRIDKAHTEAVWE